MAMDNKFEILAKAYGQIMNVVKPKWYKNPDLVDTPIRAAKAMIDMNKGAFENESDLLKQIKLFSGPEIDLATNGKLEIQSLIQVSDMEFFSMCEHHLLPFFGTATISYFATNGQILGLSKFARILKHFSAKPTCQEKIGAEVIEFMHKIGIPASCITIQAKHLCMCARGAASNGITNTETNTDGYRRRKK
jgi:GTP cyclohydrolase I